MGNTFALKAELPELRAYGDVAVCVAGDWMEVKIECALPVTPGDGRYCAAMKSALVPYKPPRLEP